MNTEKLIWPWVAALAKNNGRSHEEAIRAHEIACGHLTHTEADLDADAPSSRAAREYLGVN